MSTTKVTYAQRNFCFSFGKQDNETPEMANVFLLKPTLNHKAPTDQTNYFLAMQHTC